MDILPDKKKAIFESTLELIKDHGFQGAPMSQVAKNAGVAAGTIYHYFESKDQLIGELYAYYMNKVIAVVKTALAGDQSYKESFFNVWAQLFSFYTNHPNVLIFFEQFVNSPYYIQRHRESSHDRPLYNFFLDGIKAGQLKALKPDILLSLTFGSIISTAKLHLLGNVSLDKTDLHQIPAILWEGITAR
jgi:AcrR family transcriptional regulator